MKFRGPVRLRTALANSLNVPAVKLLSEVGVPDMVAMGRSMGLQGLDRPADQYGLSLTLGGAEVTLLSLTNAYATIDNGGRSGAKYADHRHSRQQRSDYRRPQAVRQRGGPTRRVPRHLGPV